MTRPLDLNLTQSLPVVVECALNIARTRSARIEKAAAQVAAGEFYALLEVIIAAVGRQSSIASQYTISAHTHCMKSTCVPLDPYQSSKNTHTELHAQGRVELKTPQPISSQL